MEPADAPVLEVFPNPSNGPVYLVLHLPMEASEVQLVILDATGKTMASTRPRIGTGVVELPSGTWPNGMYMAVLRSAGIQIGTVRFALAR